MIKKHTDSFSTKSSSTKQESEGTSRKSCDTSATETENEGENLELKKEEVTIQANNSVKVGDYLPYGPSLHYEIPSKLVRIKDIGEKKRLLLVGVIGSFTPECWNRHLFLVLSKIRYYEERHVDYICCVSTNDAYVQRAWAQHLGCEDNVLMWSDVNAKFTKAIGMDIVIPWLDNKVRSKRYVLLADDMVVTKIIMAPYESPDMHWNCEHLQLEYEEGLFDESWT